MRTGGHTFGYFIQLYPSYNFQLQHEELAEVEQGGAMFNTGRAVTDQEVVTLNGVEPGMISGSAANRLIGEVVQSRRRPLLGPSPG